MLYYLKSQSPQNVLKLKAIIKNIKFLDPITIFSNDFYEFNIIAGDRSSDNYSDIESLRNEYELLNTLFSKYNMDPIVNNLPDSSSNISQLIMLISILHYDKIKLKLLENVIYYEDFANLCINHQKIFNNIKNKKN